MSLPYFRMYPTDYEADTAHLTTEEDGAYFRLLRLCWRTPGCRLPADHEWIRRRVRATPDEYERAYRPVLDEFFRTEKQRVFNKRLLDEYEHSTERHLKASANGAKGGRPPKSLKSNKADKSKRLSEKKQTVSKTKANQNQNQNQNNNPLTPLFEVASPGVVEDFAAHRREIRKPLTERAVKAMASRLKGHPNPDGVLMLSIENGWQGVFPDKVTAPKSGATYGAFGDGEVVR